jgi:tetratricopeptide (TPR) repeat protein
MTKKEPRRSPRPAAALEERIEEIMDRVQKAGHNHVERVAALEEYLALAYATGQALCQQAHADYTDDVWVYVQAGIGYGDIGDYAGALEWLTAGLELALRAGDPQSALEQLRPLRASCLSALGHPSDEIQERVAHGEQEKGEP